MTATPVLQSRGYAALAALLIAVATARIAMTYRVFSNTFDEPNHIAAGMEWLERGTFNFEPKHPPLGRIAIAAGPYLAGVRLNGQTTMPRAGHEILFGQGSYLETLTLARLGILPFFLSATLCVWVWARRLSGNAGALVAVGLFTTTPAVLAHAGIATTDMPLAGTLPWALLAFVAWLDRPTVPRACVFGAAAALAMVSKMSAIVFLPTCGVALAIARWIWARLYPVSEPAPPPVRRAPGVLAAACVALALIWAAYRFSVGNPMPGLLPNSVAVIAPEFFDGIVGLAGHNAAGHPASLLGQFSYTGWWYFFPFALAVKSPVAFLVLTAAGVVAALAVARDQRDWRYVAPAIAALTILAVSMPARINIGVRHLLPMMPLMAITGAQGVIWVWNRPWARMPARAVVVGLLGWQVLSSVRAHPDYLAYFNELAGKHPERLLSDSDLDWGQDLLRLADTLRARRVAEVNLAYFGTADVSRILPIAAKPLKPGDHPPGWVAISEYYLWNANPDFAGYWWLRAHTPVASVGKSIKLFFLPTDSVPLDSSLGPTRNP